MVGSSASTIFACVASTRASATRARSPPDSVVTMRVANCFVPVSSSAAATACRSSVETGEALAWVPDQTQFLFVTPDSGKARVTLAKTILMPNDALTLKDITTKGEKATQLAANIVTGLFAGGGRTERHYEATANPEAYSAAITQYGEALESALMAIVQPALASARSE